MLKLLPESSIIYALLIYALIYQSPSVENLFLTAVVLRNFSRYIASNKTELNALVMTMAKAQAISNIAPADLQASTDDFEALVMEHGQQLYNIALRMTGNEEDANDLSQEALLRAYKSFDRWKRECSFSSWLFRIANNLYIDQVRRKRRIRFESLDAPIVTDDGDKMSRAIESDTRGPQSMAEAAEVQEKVQLALQKLTPEFRMSIILCDIQGFSYAEISEIMDCSIGTVRSRIHRARRALKAHLERYVSEAMVDEL